MKKFDEFVKRDTTYMRIFDAFMYVVLTELLIIFVLTLLLYLTGVCISYFTYNGSCGSLIESGRMSCWFECAVFSDPILVILLIAASFSWILIPLFIIATIVLTSIRYKKLN